MIPAKNNGNGREKNGNGLVGSAPYRRPKLTFGQKAADALTSGAGSWTFLIGLSVFLGLWILFNAVSPTRRWDPHPFILLNLMLSFLAAYQAPVILMSQKRNEDRDRAKSERDHAVNRHAEREIVDMQTDLDEIKAMLRRLDRKMSEVRRMEVAEAKAAEAAAASVSAEREVPDSAGGAGVA